MLDVVGLTLSLFRHFFFTKRHEYSIFASSSFVFDVKLIRYRAIGFTFSSINSIKSLESRVLVKGDKSFPTLVAMMN